MAQNMETLLESRMLDELAPDLVKQLASYVRAAQETKAHVTRSGVLVEIAMAKNAEWLAIQDVPQTIVRTVKPVVPKDAKMSPPLSTSMSMTEMSARQRKQSMKSLEASPLLRPTIPARSNRNSLHVGEDEMFLMDGVEPVSLTKLAAEEQAGAKEKEAVDLTPKTSTAGWKVPSTPR